MGGVRALGEMKEFATLSPGAQDYVRRALDVAQDRRSGLDHWSGNPSEARAIKRHRAVYAGLAVIRHTLPDDLSPPSTEFLGALVAIAAFDLGQGRLDSFVAFRFLYERLLGASIRPWLPSAFCGAASLPQIHPSHRGLLLKSISEAAATASTWSEREPVFFPDWISGEQIPAL